MAPATSAQAKSTNARLFCKDADQVKSKAHRAAYMKGWQDALADKPRSSCPYSKKAGGKGYSRAWERGWLSGQQDMPLMTERTERKQDATEDGPDSGSAAGGEEGNGTDKK